VGFEVESEGRVLEIWRCFGRGTCVRGVVWLCCVEFGSWLVHLLSGSGDVGDVRSSMAISGWMKRRKKRKGSDKKKSTFGVPWSFVFCYQTAVE
jgi:hypothetical protein